MPNKPVAFNLTNMGDTIDDLQIDTTQYGGTNVTGTSLAAAHSSVFSIVDNSAGVPVLKALIPDTLPSVTAWCTQLGSGKQFGIESTDFIGGQPTTPPWQKPKP